jgi:hypothetical protein
MRRYHLLCSALTICTLLGVTIAAQQPRIINGPVAAQPAGAGLPGTVHALVAAQTEPAWIGYAVPVADRSRIQCCWTGANGTTYISGSMNWSDAPCCGSCRIEPSDGTTPARSSQASAGQQGPVKLEGAERMVVMLRVADRQIERVRTFSEDCELDAGGRRVHWLQDVRPAESVAFLESLIGTDPDRRHRISNAALSALSMHAEPAAQATIERLARSHQAPAVRGEAIFWLAQMAGLKVAAAITRAIDTDPDTEVKKRAVFALSQLPKDQGVPLLIDVARKNPNPAVKKQAIFWLGQSKDPRAIDFFAEILK